MYPEQGEDLYHCPSNHSPTIGWLSKIRCKGADLKTFLQHASSYLFRLAEQEVMEMWVILHRLQQNNRSETVFAFALS